MEHKGIIGIYLAAGQSRRMGTNKLNLPIGGEKLGSIAFRAALESELTNIIAVMRKGIFPEWHAPFSAVSNWSSIEVEGNHSDSLKAGVKAAVQSGAKGAIILLADQPFVTSQMINLMVSEAEKMPETSFIAYSDQGICKPPIYLSSGLFPEVMKLEGDQGARRIIQKNSKGKKIEWEQQACFFDIDTKEDYEHLIEVFCKNLCLTPKMIKNWEELI